MTSSPTYPTDCSFAMLGGMYPSDLLEKIEEASPKTIHYAANAFQWKLIEGLESHLERPIYLVDRLFVGTFPDGYKKAWIKRGSFSHVQGSHDDLIGFCNVKFLRQLTYDMPCMGYLNRWAEHNQDRNRVLFVYASDFSSVAVKFKKRHPDVHVCLILPDLPMYICAGKQSFAHRLFYRRRVEATLDAAQELDSFVLLTDHMKDVLDIDENKNYVVVEGIADNFAQKKSSNKSPLDDRPELRGKRIVAYTGTLNVEYGIANLVEAFRKVTQPEARLLICGAGSGKSCVEDASRKDPRIVYVGRISPEEARCVQSEATLLINPRQRTDEYTKYSFPSKTMEYLASGTPVLCYKLDGIPDEYDPYLTYIKGDSVRDLAEAIDQSLSQETRILERQGKDGRNFVLSKKNPSSQGKKILSMVFKHCSDSRDERYRIDKR